MRSLKSTTATSTSTTLKGKRKLAQTKDYPDSPPATPPQEKNDHGTTKSRITKKQVIDLNSPSSPPPAKRRRSSDRIANNNKSGKKRQSMEDDDGFVFTRAPKQRRKAAQTETEVPSQRVAAKPFLMDFTADVLPLPLFWQE